MSLQKYKAELKLTHCTELLRLIDYVFQQDANSITDKLYMAGLSEVRISLLKKTIEIKKSYKVGFTPVQAIALIMLYSRVSTDAENHFGYIQNKLMLMSFEINKQIN